MVNQDGKVYLPTNYMYGYVEIIAKTIDGGRGSIEILVAPDGGGYEEDGTWIIYTAEKLLEWNAHVMKLEGTEYPNLNTSATLMANISLEGMNWTPVGYWDKYSYAGTFDGNGYTISNLEIVSEDINHVGLFEYIGENGAVKNLTLSSDVEISGKESVGGIAGVNEGTIENCSVSGTVSGDSYVGGIAGVNYGTIENCSISGTVKGSAWYVGGISGRNEGTIKNCSVSGTVGDSDSCGTGGIAGDNYGIITACYNTGIVKGLNYVGGIVGYNSNTDSNNSAITACYNTGEVLGSTSVGGIIGSNSATVTACYWSVPEGSSADYGIGNQPDSTATPMVGENGVTWETAKSAMNDALSGYGYKYTKNPDSTTNDTMPLIIDTVESSN